jgi:trehalose 6-phosphate phosphatase
MNGTALGLKQHDSFFSKINEADKRVLLFDYDGTVAPFVSDREKALPYPGITDLLRRIEQECNTQLIVVTGRPAQEIVPLLGMSPLPEIWGTYGLEQLHGDGARWCCQYDETDFSNEAADALAEAEVDLDAAGLRENIEVKMVGVAVHWRGLDPSETHRVRTKAHEVLEPLSRSVSDLVLAEFDEGLELRLQSANKAHALHRLLRVLEEDVPIAYLGDDATDEDAFRILNGRGLTVFVGTRYKFTSAQMWLKPPSELIAFLEAWIRACSGKLPS